MAKTDRTAFQANDWPAAAGSKTTACRPALGYYALTLGHRGPLRLLRSRPAQRLISLILALAGLQFYLLHSEYSSALAAKYSPTLFTRLSLRDKELLESHYWKMDASDQNKRREQLLNSRDQWRRLGSGCEGDTFSFNNSVIKVFKPGRSPLRNCVPNSASELRWPPEIPVSLLLGGLSDQQYGAISDRTDFLPVYDYFLSPTEDSSPGQWHLVTPLMKTGTLEHLSKRLQNQSTSQTAEDVDARYRTSFNRLLKALNIMHVHRLCHDDIKMDNIFVADSTQPSGNTSSPSEKDAHWLLADLGNTRQANHSYHSSLLWAHDNGQNTDCRINDVVRLLKSYLIFLQAAAGPRDSSTAFNKAFLTTSAPWSRLYWYTMNSAHGNLDGATAAQQILKMSTGVFAPDERFAKLELYQRAAPVVSVAYSGNDDWKTLSQPRLKDTSWSAKFWPGSGRVTQEATLVADQLRTGMSASERWARIYGTLGILPIPSGQC